jgi:hypothetical protein
VHKVNEISSYHGANMKITVFWDVGPCSLVEIGRRFKGAYCLHYSLDDGGSKHL